MEPRPLPDKNPARDTLLLPEDEPTESIDLSVLEIGRHLQEAGRAAEALALFGEPGTTASEAMTDLVTALRHLADRDRLSWSEVARWAETHYYNRTRGEGGHPLVAAGMTGVRLLPDLVLHHRPAETVRRENAERADRAARAARKFYGGSEDAEIGAEIITDLLTGLRHLADLLPDVFWSAVTDIAEWHYHAEIRGEP